MNEFDRLFGMVDDERVVKGMTDEEVERWGETVVQVAIGAIGLSLNRVRVQSEREPETVVGFESLVPVDEDRAEATSRVQEEIIQSVRDAVYKYITSPAEICDRGLSLIE